MEQAVEVLEEGVTRGRVAVVGNAVVDIAVRGAAGSEGEARDGWGEATRLVEEPIEALLGGCGAACAYVLAGLGVATTLTTNLGNDAFGDLLGRWLARAGVTVTGQPARMASAVHVVQVDDQGRRRSTYHTGPKVRWAEAVDQFEAAWLLAAGYGGVEAGDAVELAEVFEALRARGARLLFDPGPWFARCLDRERMLGLWAQVDVLTGTREELAHWLPERAAVAPAAAVEVAVAACAVGPETVVVKDGSRGAAYARRKGERGTVAAEPVNGGSSVGAGDTFDARLVAGLAGGESLPTAVGGAVELATRVVRGGRGALGAFDHGE